MNFNIDKEQLKGLGKIGLKIGKQIVLDGTKSLIVKSAMVAIETAFGRESFKTIKLDDVLSGRRLNGILFKREEVIDTKSDDPCKKEVFVHDMEKQMDAVAKRLEGR